MKQLSKTQLWLFRLAWMSIPIALLCASIYCVVNHVPNPRSVVPKSAITLISALTFALYFLLIDGRMRSSKLNEKERNMTFYIVTVFVSLFWIIAYFIRHNSEFNFTGDGDPVFPILWFLVVCMKWYFEGSKDSSTKEAST